MEGADCLGVRNTKPRKAETKALALPEIECGLETGTNLGYRLI